MLRRLLGMSLVLGIVGLAIAQEPSKAGKDKPGATPPAKAKGGPDPEMMVDQILQRMDKNKDGKISKSEAEGRIAENFDRIDTNKDGFLDRAELLVMARRIAAQGGPGPGRRPPLFGRPGGMR